MSDQPIWPPPLDTDRLRRQLDATASELDVGTPLELDRLRATATRRTRRRNGALGVAAAAVLLVGGGAALGVGDRGDRGGSDAEVAVDASTSARSADELDEPPIAVDDAPGQPEAAEFPSTAAEPSPDAALSTGPVGATPLPEASTAEPAEVPPAETVPPAVREEELDDAPLVDLSAEPSEPLLVDWGDGLIRSDPDAVELGPTAAERRIVAEFSTDGESWDPIDLTVPAGVALDEVVSTGDRLVALARSVDDAGSLGSASVVSTTDLTTWAAESVPLPRDDDAVVEAALVLATVAGWTVEVVVTPRDPLADVEVLDVTAAWGEAATVDSAG